MGLFSWFKSTEEPPRRRLADLERRVEDLEAGLEHLTSQHRKLRGRVTGGIRTEDAPPTAPEPPELTISPPVDQHTQEIENGRLLASLRGNRGILRG